MAPRIKRPQWDARSSGRIERSLPISPLSIRTGVRFGSKADIRKLIPGTDWNEVQLTQSFAQANDGTTGITK
jgi:hypothetical protein